MWPAEVVDTFCPLDVALHGAALGTSISANANGALHVGIVYRTSQSLEFLHLGWENQLYVEPAIVGSLVGFSAFHRENQRHVARYCAMFARKHAGTGPFPWGFGFTGDPVFDATGDWVTSPISLTCATFVLAIFLANGYGILAYKTWPTRPQDLATATALAEKLPQEARARELERVASPRVRPEEAALAVTGSERVIPLMFARLGDAGDRLRERALEHDREQAHARSRALLGDELADACANGTLADLLRRGLPSIDPGLTANWAREVTRDPTRGRAVLRDIERQLRRQLPDDLDMLAIDEHANLFELVGRSSGRSEPEEPTT